MKIINVSGMYAFTDDGLRIRLPEIKGSRAVGAFLTDNGDGTYTGEGMAVDVDCPSGVCPIR